MSSFFWFLKKLGLLQNEWIKKAFFWRKPIAIKGNNSLATVIFYVISWA
jgi:hypothetical protein